MIERSCRMIEVAHPIQNRNQFTTLDNLDLWIKSQKDDVDLYTSFLRYFTDDPYMGGVMAGFGMDFDDEQNPERARKEALIVIRYLRDRYDIGEFSICFSGNKGFHVFVNHSWLGIEPHFWLPKIFKEMARELVKQHGLRTLDLAIYDRRRMIRLPNCRHGRTMLYKIWLTFSELENLNIDQIKAIAVKPRQMPPKPDYPLSERAKAWFESNRDKFMKKLEERRDEFKDADFKAAELLPCVKKRLELGAPEHHRNCYTWQMASYLCRSGRSLEECTTIMDDWYGRFEIGIDPFPKEEMADVIKRVYGVGGYIVGCASEFVEDLCIGKTKCPLFMAQLEKSEIPPEAMAKAEEILKGDPLKYIADRVHAIHVGDDELIQMEYISALSPKISRRQIHCWSIGTSGKGKSFSMQATLKALPKESYVILTSASPVSLFYYCRKYGEYALNEKLVFIDEFESSKFAEPMVRTLTSPTDIDPRHLSVHEAELLDLRIRGRRTVWLDSVKPFGREQVRNRFIFLNPNESAQQDEDVHRKQNETELDDLEIDEGQFITAQAVTKIILERTANLRVRIPFNINWPYKRHRSLYPKFISTVRVIAKINFKSRKVDDEGSIIAEAADLERAKGLWGAFIDTIVYRTSRPSQQVLAALSFSELEAKTKAELATELRLSTQYVARMLEELEEAEMVNVRKREGKDRKGLHSEEFWKPKLPEIADLSWEPRDLLKLSLHGGDQKIIKKLGGVLKNEFQEVHNSRLKNDTTRPMEAEFKNDGLNLLPYDLLDSKSVISADSSDSLITCGQCRHHYPAGGCPKEKPDLVRDEATFPSSCPKFKPKVP